MLPVKADISKKRQKYLCILEGIMKLRNLFAFALAAIIALGAVGVLAASSPVDGGKTLFTAEDFKVDYDSVKGNGAFKAYRADMEVVSVDGKDAVKFTAQKEAKQALIDFSYYQYNNSEYLPALNTTDYKYLKISYKRAAATTADFGFWKATEDNLGSGGKNGTCTFKADSTSWDTIIIDLTAQSGLNWTEKNIRQFRLYPWGMVNADGFAGEVIYIEYLGFFKTEAEAKAFTLDKPKTETKPTTSPATFDLIALPAVAAIASSAVIVGKKRKSR